ncbi:acylphosphatase [Candidatus Pacearchaeota archaeon ex4484_26]|nr:MAG: acylphosphatase [Candidatus Pacearchaeota archaeon ex4484_26]RLF35112.1 MAG: acylphosphatase [Thermoplasmata archaeon]
MEDKIEQEEKAKEKDKELENIKRVHVFISGKVQGVFFRAFVNRNAEELQLKGWVKNTGDGRVEAVFEGDERAIKKIIELCNEGPAGAKVENVEYKEEEPIGEKGFEIRY